MVLAAATLGFGVIQLDVSVVNVAVKPIATALGGGVSGVQWVVDAYTLVFAALILSAGALGDRSGHKRLLMAGFAVFTVASAACGLVPAIGELIAARAVQGTGAAALGASSLSLITASWASPCSAPSSPASIPPPAWKPPSPSARGSSPSSPHSAMLPPDRPARPTGESQKRKKEG
jgi:MFS family permease